MPRRRELRLRAFDYRTPGFYVVTACASRRGDLFGTVAEMTVELNGIGRTLASQLMSLPERLAGVGLDVWIVMPDHVHAIFELDGSTSLGRIVAAFKSGASRETGLHLWQRGYFDHVVRDDDDLDRAREYIETNPLRRTLARASQGSPLHKP